MTNAGTLYIVATPIGNLDDITARALQVLRSVDLIAAEDTRHSKKLCQHFAIKTPLKAYHNFNEQTASRGLLKLLQQGKNIALITDAGTPLISDPGYRLVNLVSQAGIKVVTVPGACALIAALSVAGLPTEKFVFEGFLPTKTIARCKRLQELTNEQRTLVFYVSPHRLVAVLEDMRSVFGEDQQAVLARELTKKFETVLSNNLGDLLQTITENPDQQKGEMVLLLQGATVKKDHIDAVTLKILETLSTELSAKQAASLTAKITGKSKNKLYQALVKAEVDR